MAPHAKKLPSGGSTGAAASSRCRWCWRCREHPNPSEHHDGPHLKFLASENLCIPCRQTLSTGFAGEDLRKLYKAVCEEPAPRRQEFLDALERWTEMHNKSPKGMVTKKTFNEGYDETVSTLEASAMQVEELHGYLWPVALLARRFPSEKHSKADMTTVSHKGVLVTGVVKSPDAGWMPGVLKLSSTTTSGVEKKTTLGTTSEALREGQVDSMFNAEVANLRADTAEQADDDDDGGCIKFKRRRVEASTKAADEVDADSAFSARFSARIFGCAGSSGNAAASVSRASSAGTSGGSPAPKRSRMSSATSAGSTLPSPGVPEASPSGKQAKLLMKRSEERNLAELALLEGEQVMKAASDEGALFAMTVNRVKSAFTKVERRTQPKAIEGLVWAPEGQDDDWETTAKIKQLGGLQRQLGALTKLVSALCPPKGQPRAAVRLRAAMSELEANGVAVLSAVRGELLSLEASQAIDDEDYVTFRTILSSGADGCAKKDMPGSDFSSAQRAVIEKAFKSHIKGMHAEQGAAKLHKLVQSLGSVDLGGLISEGDQSIKILLSLASLSTVKGSEVTAEKVAEVQGCVKAFREDEKLAFHKLFVTWGGPIADNADVWIGARTNDLTQGAVLSVLKAQATNLKDICFPIPTDIASPCELAKLRKELEPWQKLASQAHETLNTATPAMLESRSEEVAMIKKRTTMQASLLEEFFAKRFSAHLASFLSTLCELLKGPTHCRERKAKELVSSMDTAQVQMCGAKIWEKLEMAPLIFDATLAEMKGPAVRNECRLALKTFVSNCASGIDVFSCNTRGFMKFIPMTAEKMSLYLGGVDDMASEEASWKGLKSKIGDLAGILRDQWTILFKQAYENNKCMNLLMCLADKKAPTLKALADGASQGRAGAADDSFLEALAAEMDKLKVAQENYRFVFVQESGEPVLNLSCKQKVVSVPLALCLASHTLAKYATSMQRFQEAVAQVSNENSLDNVIGWLNGAIATSASMSSLCQDLSGGCLAVQRLRTLLEGSAEILRNGRAKLIANIRVMHKVRLESLESAAKEKDIDVLPFIQEDGTVAEGDIEKLKTVWRSDAAKLLLQADDAYSQFHAGVMQAKVGGDSADFGKLIEDLSGAHDDRYPEVEVLIAAIAVSQSCFRTLRAGESRQSVVLMTKTSMAGTVRLPPRIERMLARFPA